MNRRDFLKNASTLGGAMLVAPGLLRSIEIAGPPPSLARVAFVKTTDRAAGVARAVDLLELGKFGSRDLFLKPNFNSADSTPGSTSEETLAAIVKKLKTLGAGLLTIGDRSGMGNTREVMDRKHAFTLGRELGARVIVFDELDADGWERLKPSGSHWQQGFAIPRVVRQAGGIVQTCCLKTHRFGGHFTLSLKNSVGFAAKTVPGNSYNFMRELHSSPDQRRMIAEINTAYRPDLIVLDGVQAFTHGGPDEGKLVNSQVILAGTDRVAIDAVGVALLRHFGTTPEVSRGAIFEQEQIARAVQLGIGVSGPEQIELITGDPESAAYAKQIRAVLHGAPGAATAA
ncbi:MAG TPA: DUF362 domain-containing protein [Candidatus Limnocylindrales bacterium]|nr:DUF362 domain-containing protein [Candidatus Limnocylindrales bacterium]